MISSKHSLSLWSVQWVLEGWMVKTCYLSLVLALWLCIDSDMLKWVKKISIFSGSRKCPILGRMLKGTKEKNPGKGLWCLRIGKLKSPEKCVELKISSTWGYCFTSRIESTRSTLQGLWGMEGSVYSHVAFLSSVLLWSWGPCEALCLLPCVQCLSHCFPHRLLINVGLSWKAW